MTIITIIVMMTMMMALIVKYSPFSFCLNSGSSEVCASGVTGTVCPEAKLTTPSAELTMGQWVMGQMGQQIWVGHMGHGSVPVTP